MSELIDRIFDAEKISAEINTILENLSKVKSEMAGFGDVIKTTMGEVRKAKGGDELAASTKKLNDQFSEGQKVAKTWQDEVAKLNEKTKQLTDTERAGSIEIAKARLELQAAQKATKEAALAEIEATSATKNLAGSYNALNEDLKNSIKAFKAMSEEERNSASGKELLKKIADTNASLKATDASMGNYQRNVGNYASALDGLSPQLGGLYTKLMNISKAAKDNADKWGEMGNNTNMGIQSMGQAPAGLAKIVAGFKGLGQMISTVGKAMLGNPVIAVIAAIVFVIGQMKQAIDDSEERTNKMNEAFAKFKPILRTIGDIFEVIVDVVLKYVDVLGSAYSAVTEFLGINPKGSADAFVAAEQTKAKVITANRKLNEDAAAQEAVISEMREKLADKETYNYEQRLQFLKKAQAAEKRLADDKAKIASNNRKQLEQEYKLDDMNKSKLDELSAARIAESQAKESAAAIGRKLGKEQQKLALEHEADLKAEAAEAKAAAEKIIAARRRLIDSQLAIMKEGKEKQIALSSENYKRQIEDLQRNGELTKQLASNLLIAHNQELKKINDEWKKKDLDDAIKSDELKLENMKRAGVNTLEFEKKLFKERKEAEILAGADREEVNKKYRFMELDLIAKNADEKASLFQKEIEKRAATLKQGYDVEELELKKKFASGKISQQEYEDQLNQIKLNALKDGNEILIKGLQEELRNNELSKDKRAELSSKLAELQIANENAVTDATIKANEDRIAADRAAIEKRKAITSELVSKTVEVFDAIGEYQKQQSENRIAQLEAEQEKSDEKFSKEQEMLDGALMSDENRAAKQKELNEKKAAADKAIQEKIKAEKIKQAKWDKAMSIVNVITSTSLGVMKAFEQTGVFGAIFAALIAATGAIQLATIMSQPIPAFKDGGVTKGGAVLWGEAQTEIAVTPSGETFLADTPTVTAFDAGTRIYKSVSDYENAMSLKGGGFAFDYDKMAEKMPKQNIVLDSRGLWGIVSKQGDRRTMINRRYSV